RLATAQLSYSQGHPLSMVAPVVDNVYFGGKLIRTRGKTVAVDRLGTIRADSEGARFANYPYGEPNGASSTFAGMYDPDRGYNNQTAMWGPGSSSIIYDGFGAPSV
ncbi:MAG: hypothetical protein C5B51_31640, partial [Terriglobia bacterium]